MWHVLSRGGSSIPHKWGAPTLQGGNIDLTKIFEKLHEIEKLLGVEGRPLRSATGLL